MDITDVELDEYLDEEAIAADIVYIIDNFHKFVWYHDDPEDSIEDVPTSWGIYKSPRVISNKENK
jgi:hypothetical protein